MSRPYTFFMLLRSQPDWLRLARAERRRFVADEIAPLLTRHPEVRLRFYDAEAFSGRCTDVAVFETADLAAYRFLVDGLRDTPFFSHPYFTVVDIVPAVEDGYVEYDGEERARQAD
ncbi:MAG: darcynin family protein [Reyranellaceae bacterium]